MTPKEKAKKLVDTMMPYVYIDKSIGEYYNAKHCALMAVDEIINEIYNISHQYTAIYDEKTKFYNYNDSKELKFWKEVKTEIEKL